MSLERTLAALESMLHGFNYQVFLRIHRVALQVEGSGAAYVAAALGPSTTVGRETQSSCPKLLADVEECLRYEGDSGSGPAPEVIKSAAFAESVAQLNAELAAAALGHLIIRVQIEKGHPAYPVFWEFAYVVAGRSSCVLLGCSSD